MTTMTPAAADLTRTLFPQTPSKGRVYNFSAGPACMPECVLEQIREELIDCRGGGIGLLELSHRGALYDALNNEAEAACRKAAGVGSDYAVFFMPGGATMQFACCRSTSSARLTPPPTSTPRSGPTRRTPRPRAAAPSASPSTAAHFL